MAPKHSKTDPRILGLTGRIACGKTTVGDELLTLGAMERIDADRVVHDLMQSGTATSQAIVQHFGSSVVATNGAIDRQALGSVVFNDRDALRDLEAIVHPDVRAAIRRRLRELSGAHGVVVLDAVKLLQSDLLQLCDAVWVVECSREVQMRRLRETRGMSTEEAQSRIAAQPDFNDPAVTRVISNSGSLHELWERVKAAWTEQLASWDRDQPASPSRT